MEYNLIVVTGATASGKTRLAAQIAEKIGGEVISADSRQVYKRMDLGTGKDYDDYLVNGIRVPVHLIDLAEPGYRYSVFEYQRDFLKVFNEMRSRKKMPVLCGGTGMYIEAALLKNIYNEVPENKDVRHTLKDKPLHELQQILKELRPLHNRTDTDNPQRAIRAIEIAIHERDFPSDRNDYPQIVPTCLGVKYNRNTEREHIAARLKQRMSAGMLQEVTNLLASGLEPESLVYYGLEYRYLTEYLTGKIGFDDMLSQLTTAIQQYAKRQHTWFRRMERTGLVIHWIAGEQTQEEKLKLACSYSGLTVT